MRVVEEIKKWQKTAGIENQLYAITLLFSIPYFLGRIIFDISNSLGQEFLMLDVTLFLICIVLIVFTRYRTLLPFLILFFTFLLIAGTVYYWTISGGVYGGGAYIFILVSVLVSLMSSKKLQLLVAVVLGSVMVLLVSEFDSTSTRINYNQLLFEFILNLVFLIVLSILFRLAMDKEQRVLEKQNQDIIEINDELDQKSIELEAYNSEIKLIQENLEEIVENRSERLRKQNIEDIEYAFINAHLIRAPIANIIGLTEHLPGESNEKSELMKHVISLDMTVRKIGNVLSQE